jgi:hypothetical protein
MVGRTAEYLGDPGRLVVGETEGAVQSCVAVAHRLSPYLVSIARPVVHCAAIG